MSFNHEISITFVISILNYCFSKIIRLFYFHINSLCCESNNFISSVPVSVTKEQSIYMLTFIDESGYPRPTDSTKNPILLGVCIHENDIKPITNQIYKLKDSIYGKQDEIKSTKLIREATITKNRTNNKAYVEGMVDIITSYDAAIFAIIMDKPDEPIIVPEHHLPNQYYILLKKVEFYCNHHHYGKAMMIFDEVHEDADRKIAEAITGFLFKTRFGRSFHHILEMPLFVSSAVTPAVQFADIFVGIVRHRQKAGNLPALNLEIILLFFQKIFYLLCFS